MRRLSIKEAFGGEVAFTKYIAENSEVSQSLLDCVDISIGSDYKIHVEHRTVDGKRVDLSVQDSDGTIIAVIESQDTTGWLDSVHASKIFYYAYEKSCVEGIILTEDATEHVKGFVRFMNEQTPFNIWLIVSRIWTDDINNRKIVDFVPVIRPTEPSQKKVKRQSNSGDSQGAVKYADFLAQKYEENSELFTSYTGHYIDRKNVSNSRLNVGIEPRNGFFNVSMHHRGIFNNETFNKSFSDLVYSEKLLDLNGVIDQPLFNGVCARLKVENWETSLEVAKCFISAIENGRIKTGSASK